MKRRWIKRSFFWSVLLIVIALAAMVGLAVLRLPVPTSALQIRPARVGVSLPDGFFVYQGLSQRGIRIKSITPLNDGLVVELVSPAQRKMAGDVLQDILPPGFTIQYCEPPSKAWFQKLDRQRLKFG